MILFVAIDLENIIELNFIQKQLKNKLENLDLNLNWVNPQDFHITLAFIGKIKEENLDQLNLILNNIKFYKFKIKLENLELNKSNNIIWIKVKSDELEELAHKIKEILHKSLKLDNHINFKRTFIPHVTILRIKNEILSQEEYKKIQNILDQINYNKVTLAINEFCLYESKRDILNHLKSSKYHKISNFNLY
ncbi:RNA 2',3'-cyclic phosphodiesterase [Candidatus Babela massiliensis]|uniref:RNA 2',3'-cyclic phosphodiesterase n=1 Tax=Candidatus Babela massiliensis TaxID=673862 RepID=V6DHC8_9BACT|nr:RNA 2',3'-cyclic phosphodiesterase [Candidatus Babela massiliensis]CDK30977.1 2'-5' RNA ligase [Candidatus Babela massiliensis]